MKKCPYCDEKIQKVAKKCRFCGEWLNDKKVNKDEELNNKKITVNSFLSGLFKGRLDRKRFFWGIVLFFTIRIILVEIQNSIYYAGSSSPFSRFIGWGTLLVFVFLCISLLVRRLHDTNRSGKKLFWAFLGIIMPLLFIWYFAIIFEKGDNNKNKYGRVPSNKINFWDALFNLKSI